MACCWGVGVSVNNIDINNGTRPLHWSHPTNLSSKTGLHTHSRGAGAAAQLEALTPVVAGIRYTFPSRPWATRANNCLILIQKRMKCCFEMNGSIRKGIGVCGAGSSSSPLFLPRSLWAPYKRTLSTTFFQRWEFGLSPFLPVVCTYSLYVLWQQQARIVNDASCVNSRTTTRYDQLHAWNVKEVRLFVVPGVIIQ